MVLKNNFEKSLKELETRIKELEQSNEGLRTKFEYFEAKVIEREEENKSKQEIINKLEEKVKEEAIAKQVVINNFKENIREREECVFFCATSAKDYCGKVSHGVDA
ncbi:16851_t:CDS:2 [Funneliformis mosseae]|uniref:16851_t:CDS:1 n=1 Tax=Funneliformis mosseae TaxID=27381 RepID=A0A9N9CYQ4_FUNMO|nr:16851_t:CDS:2 [Funneliformis mosseae]